MRGMTQIELAKKVGVGQYTISCWEHGRLEPSLAKLIKVAEVLDVSLDVLLGNKKGAKNDKESEVDTLIKMYISNVYFVNLAQEFEKCPEDMREKLIRIMRVIIKEFPQEEKDLTSSS